MQEVLRVKVTERLHQEHQVMHLFFHVLHQLVVVKVLVTHRVITVLVVLVVGLLQDLHLKQLLAVLVILLLQILLKETMVDILQVIYHRTNMQVVAVEEQLLQVLMLHPELEE